MGRRVLVPEFKEWPKRDRLDPAEVVSLYEQGFAGALPSTPETRAEFESAVVASGGVMNASTAAEANGWAVWGHSKDAATEAPRMPAIAPSETKIGSL